MQAKLYKREDRYDLYAEDDHKIASSASNTFGKLSKQNCDEIFWGLYDTEIEVEIEVEIEMEDVILPHGANEYYIKSKPKLDSNKCLILKKI